MNVAAVNGRRARRSNPMEVAARLGLTGRALIYLLLGAVTLALALGHRRPEADQRGALQELATHAGGLVVLWVIAAGMVGYALWRLAEAAFGTAGEGQRAGPRLQSLGRALVYTFLAVTAFSVIAGRHRSQAAQSRELSARLMAHGGGRLLVGVIGAVVVVIAGVLIVQGFRRSFVKYLRLGRLSRRARTLVIGLGVVGTVARGIVFALAGALVIDAAVRFDPDKASGIDAAIRTVAEQPLGRALLILTAAGLIAFGTYGLAEARWRIT